ncbi:hypothetical protein P5673_028604 [Acropora cervicornis]|uniref:Uncharacterized protein n=1 Tax=Acropora cervicornis TaxID=6130 RepID=A0AAD9PXJ5_ACRCE|nr:hypothetical protein P5673_028604 [Acropora cervicornis]
MDAIYKENPSIQPPYVVDSSKKSGESDLSDEETTSFEGSVKSKKKTKLEKSLDTICANFMEVSQADVKRLEEVEEKRHERELKYRLELQRIESERRREEREHEMKLMQMLMHARGFSSNPPVAVHQYDSTA